MVSPSTQQSFQLQQSAQVNAAAPTGALQPASVTQPVSPARDLSHLLDVFKSLVPKHDLSTSSSLGTKATSAGSPSTVQEKVEMPPQLAEALDELKNASARAIVPGVVVTALSSTTSSLKRIQQGQ
ncbi:MAG: hypothetical protein JWM36_2494 [Hyphomicrobiales bacterium]|nr:hypothetical protein [Hyphomicrobiales bacterium]